MRNLVYVNSPERTLGGWSYACDMSFTRHTLVRLEFSDNFLFYTKIQKKDVGSIQTPMFEFYDKPKRCGYERVLKTKINYFC